MGSQAGVSISKRQKTLENVTYRTSQADFSISHPMQTQLRCQLACTWSMFIKATKPRMNGPHGITNVSLKALPRKT